MELRLGQERGRRNSPGPWNGSVQPLGCNLVGAKAEAALVGKVRVTWEGAKCLPCV